MNLEKALSFINQYFSFQSYVIIGYFFLCFIIFIFNKISKDKVTSLLKIRRGHLLNPMNYIRLFTSGLCHSDFQHFRNNFIFILLLGPIIENKVGSLVMLEMILITTLVSSLFHLIFYDSSAIGASDVVYMMVVYLGLTSTFDNRIPLTFVFLFLFFVLGEIVLMFFHKRGDKTGHDGHVMGAVMGIIFTYFPFF